MNQIPPQVPEIEAAVIGAMLLDSSIIPKVTSVIDESCFYREVHRKIYKIIIFLSKNNKAVDILTVTDELRIKGLLEEIGGSYYLTECISLVTTSVHIVDHIKRIKETALLRKIIEVSSRTAADAYGTGVAKTAFEIIKDYNSDLHEIEKLYDNTELSISKDLDDVMQLTLDSSKFLIPYGIDSIDKDLGGMSRGEVSIISGRPAMGKTSFIIDRSIAWANKGYKILIFSLDLVKYNFYFKLLSNILNLEFSKIRDGNFKDVGGRVEAKIKINELTKSWEDKYWVIDNAHTSAEIARQMSIYPADIVIIDYIQKVRDNKKYTSRKEDLDSVIRNMIHVSRRKDQVLLLLSQINRTGASRPGRQGDFDGAMLDDLAESDFLSQTAREVFVIYYEYSLTQDIKVINKIKLRSVKTTFYAGGEITLEFFPKTGRFGGKI